MNATHVSLLIALLAGLVLPSHPSAQSYPVKHPGQHYAEVIPKGNITMR